MPGLLCSLRGHRAEARVVRNRGRAFSRCARCGADLVELDGEWRAPPKGARIVWTPADAVKAEPAESELPVVESDRRNAPEGDRRGSAERRKAKGPLPSYLRGKERRSGARDRRRAFGRRFRGE